MELSNFEHLKDYPDVYEKCITDEKTLKINPKGYRKKECDSYSKDNQK